MKKYLIFLKGVSIFSIPYADLCTINYKKLKYNHYGTDDK